MLYRLIIFLVINFAALGLGGLFTGKGVPSDWYQNLDKAPWTPPGWVFGFAWTTIMICFSVYMAYAWDRVENVKILLLLFIVQWILNVLWSPVFFHFHFVLPGLIVIVLLTMVIGVLLFKYLATLQYITVFILPYVLWLIVATSLNAYILMKN